MTQKDLYLLVLFDKYVLIVLSLEMQACMDKTEKQNLLFKEFLMRK